MLWFDDWNKAWWECIYFFCAPNLKLACFVCFLKIINTFLKSNVCIFQFKELKNGIEIVEGQEVLKLWIKTVNIVSSITQEPLSLRKF